MFRKSFWIVLLVLFPILTCSAKKEKRSVVRIETTAGIIRVALLDDAPIHRDNFLKLVDRGHYDGTLFHRVIKDFMIQGGDPDSRNAAPGVALGEGDVKYTLPAEFLLPYFYHLRGALAAARQGDDVNPLMRSSGSQFYIVWGKDFKSSSELNKVRDRLEENGIEMTRQMYDEYLQRGGAPHLDGTYTVFGEVIEGLDVVFAIQGVATDERDRPLEDVKVLRMVIEQRSKAAQKKAVSASK